MKSKITTRDELKKICVALRREGRKIGFTSGIFDIMHAGHADYLEKAKKLCDVLVVAVNADSSVKKLKGEKRPIFPEKERIKLVASLQAVDYAFLFSEERNERNIKALKPHYYIKAGDYSPGSLTSAKIAESFGGRVKIIKVMFGTSTTKTVEKILALYGGRRVDEKGAVHVEKPGGKKARAVFLDRDGTINVDIGYLHEPEKLRFMPGAVKGMRKMQDMGFRLVIVTTQAGIGLGYFTKEDFYGFNREMMKRMSRAGIKISKIYFCPHGKDQNCGCRKPGTDLIMMAEKDLNLDLGKSYFVGDTEADIEAGRMAGTATILVGKNAGGNRKPPLKPDYIARDLLDAAGYISRDSSIQSR